MRCSHVSGPNYYLELEWTHFCSVLNGLMLVSCTAVLHTALMRGTRIRGLMLQPALYRGDVWCFHLTPRLVSSDKRLLPTPQSAGPLLIFMFIVIFVFFFFLWCSFLSSLSVSAGSRIGAAALGRAKIRRSVLLQYFVAAGRPAGCFLLLCVCVCVVSFELFVCLFVCMCVCVCFFLAGGESKTQTNIHTLVPYS